MEEKIMTNNSPWILTSSTTTTTTILLSLLFTIFIILRRNKSSSSKMVWPTGPKTLPIIGNMNILGGTALHVVLHNLAKTYGNVMTIWIGSWRPVIVVSDIDRAWEVLVNKSSDYSARDMPEITKLATADWKTISSSDSGPFWTNLRKGLQNVALSPQNLSSQSKFQERDIIKTIQNLKEEAKMNNGIVKPLDHLKKAMVRLISRLIYGQDFDNDEYVEEMHHTIEELIRVSGYARLAEAFYYAKYLPSHKKAVREVLQANQRVQNLVRPLLSLNSPTNTYLHFLRSQNYEDEVIIFAIFEAYLLGVDSTSSTTAWALAYLIREPNVQEKLYEELKNFTNDNDRKMVKFEDLNKLQYLQAVVKETMRMKPIAPLAIPHKACRETSLMGRKVNQGTRVMVNIYALHHNQNVWKEPYKFNPERFLQKNQDGVDGKAMEQSLLPFSAGMRICAGMELGKLQFSFALANLVNAFKWSCVSDGVFPDMSDQLGFVLLMKTPLEAGIVPRM
uniref:Trifunctional (S)-stylopine synthase/(S)-nandinine synthase/(S)-canadine synthase n=1 Tax=Argemone mexicana TaxID=54796 RepID=C719D_ARGME|nr:RecName: Full=Trifunctional (S)-stylopine synthase/(S)-nandinine synthase/(S)-canadine synthase; Short=STS; AltName: Full=Cytochrome P450 719A13 [Argemone mexicana]ABR14721.1 stylopine synthase [Argemone mexicana]ANY58137.1 CYP719A13 [synthetic construct]